MLHSTAPISTRTTAPTLSQSISLMMTVAWIHIQTRIAHINGAVSGGQNGAFRLSVGSGTVLDDGDDDKLTGSSGDDWFFLNVDDDRATDLQDEVFADDLDFILS